MSASRCLHGKLCLISMCLAVFLTAAVPGTVRGLEPVSALDDGFAVPAQTGLIEASYHYPGAEAFIRGYFGSAAWSIPFGQSDLAVTTVHAGTSFGNVGVSLSYSGSGFDLYGDEIEKAGLSYRILSAVSCGVRLTRNAMRIKGFGDASALSADLGMVYRPVESVYLAGSIEDITGAEIGDSREPLDGRTRFGVSWAMTGDITLLVSASKVRRFDPSICGGCTVNLFQSMTIGVTGGNEPDRLEFIAAFPFRTLMFSYRGAYHRDLGMSHGFSMSWEAGGK